MKGISLIFLLQVFSQSFEPEYDSVSILARNPYNIQKWYDDLTYGTNLFNRTDRNEINLIRKRNFIQFDHAPVEKIDQYYFNSLISQCDRSIVGTAKCTCPQTYRDPVVIENKRLKSLATVVINEKYKQIVVSYRPTVVTRNWMTNINCFLVRPDFARGVSGVRVHRGFYNYYRSLRKGTHNAVIEKLRDPRYKGYTLHITGYSLGAAISTLSTPDWVNLLKKMNDNRRIEVFSYSSPRVGNRAFVNYLSSLKIPITRFTSGNDLVPHLAPLVFGYVHGGVEIYRDLKTKGLRVCGQNYYEDLSCGLKHIRMGVNIHMEPFDYLPKDPYC